MKLGVAIKAFLKALKQPEAAEGFLQDKPKIEGAQDRSHLRLLSLLQQSSRFVDFLQEDLSQFSDAQVGAAVRKIHQDCGKALEELVTVRPIRDESEGAKITVPQGYDPTQIKVVGKVKGEPPYQGELIHRGWKAHKMSLPKQVGSQLNEVICPAEVEIKS